MKFRKKLSAVLAVLLAVDTFLLSIGVFPPGHRIEAEDNIISEASEKPSVKKAKIVFVDSDEYEALLAEEKAPAAEGPEPEAEDTVINENEGILTAEPVVKEEASQPRTTYTNPEPTPVYVASPEEIALSNRGDFGCLYIPDAGINVAVYFAAEENVAQRICDAVNSAAYCEYVGLPLIADHNTQGFSKISRCVPNQTIAYLGKPNGTVEKYICKEKFNGHNTEEDITDNNYRSIAPTHQNGFSAYTCLDSWRNIVIVYFVPM